MGRDGKGVRPASDTTIEITFSYLGERCRERLALKPTPGNLKKAEQMRSALLVDIANGGFDYSKTFPRSRRRLLFLSHPAQGASFERYMEDWLVGQKAMVKASTWNDYRKIVRNVLAGAPLARVPLADVDRAAMRTFCVGLTCGNKRIANILSVFRLALAQGVQDNVLQDNVLDGWSYAKAEPIREDEEVDVFTAEEQAKVLAQLTPKNRNWFQFAFWTGLRTSEMIALEWRDIDFDAGTIRVVRAQTKAAEKPEAPKTRAGRRIVKMLGPARAALMAQREHTLVAGGRVWHINQDKGVRDIWFLACRKAGVRYRKPYQTRHTYASMMLTAGENPMWIASQMGHNDLSMLRRVYGKFIPNSVPDAGGAAEAMFSGGMTALRQPGALSA